jgi:hypothetical protein
MITEARIPLMEKYKVDNHIVFVLLCSRCCLSTIEECCNSLLVIVAQQPLQLWYVVLNISPLQLVPVNVQISNNASNML